MQGAFTLISMTILRLGYVFILSHQLHLKLTVTEVRFFKKIRIPNDTLQTLEWLVILFSNIHNIKILGS